MAVRVGAAACGSFVSLALLAACAGRAPAPPAAAEPPAAPAARAQGRAATPPFPQAAGEVIGRGERLLIYLPHDGDQLPAIAARFLGDADKHWTIAEANGVPRAEAGQPLIVPLQPLNPTGVRNGELQTVPILCYHRFGAGGAKMVVSPANFAAQLDWLARNDYQVLKLSQVAGFLAGREPLPRRSVVITIDDGYESVYRHAWPLLKKHGFTATLFVYTDFIGAADGLSWAQLQEMAASGVIDIQAHSKTHRNLTDRSAGESDERYRQAIETELRAPRELLEKRLAAAKVKVQQFAYPFGDANDVVLDAMSRQRYQLGVTVQPGGNAFFSQPTLLKRTMIFGDLDLDGFKSKLQISRSVSAP
ncbi:polysaccharide deacetylase family protein [Aquincola sp. S2]|uniref:Polysaccharide deacetylase family protein n=1 Tax=Pseudaquabacterium terrae TaxID=2732868 RepID=A0ABX2EBE9_9BURK|nr:polysaccharide deacetylase family protein [Aquabacterium terrae]NRF66439.1 polysaccharide deacetylase family protein [Aquabacterium terrae]